MGLLYSWDHSGVQKAALKMPCIKGLYKRMEKSESKDTNAANTFHMLHIGSVTDGVFQVLSVGGGV